MGGSWPAPLSGPGLPSGASISRTTPFSLWNALGKGHVQVTRGFQTMQAPEGSPDLGRWACRWWVRMPFGGAVPSSPQHTWSPARVSSSAPCLFLLLQEMGVKANGRAWLIGQVWVGIGSTGMEDVRCRSGPECRQHWLVSALLWFVIPGHLAAPLPGSMEHPGGCSPAPPPPPQPHLSPGEYPAKPDSGGSYPPTPTGTHKAQPPAPQP